MDGPRNYQAKWSQSDSEALTSNALTSMWNLKNRYNELCRADTDSQTLKNWWFPSETGCGVGGCTEGLGWKCYKISLWWSLYSYKCNKIHWVIKKKKKTNSFEIRLPVHRVGTRLKGALAFLALLLGRGKWPHEFSSAQTQPRHRSCLDQDVQAGLERDLTQKSWHLRHERYRPESQPAKWGEIFANNVSDKYGGSRNNSYNSISKKSPCS